jgi:polysaccharide biosynthesis protein PslG
MGGWGFSAGIQKGLQHALLAVSLLASLLGTTAYAQPSAGRPPFRYGIIVSNPGNYSEVAKLGFGYVKLYGGWNSMEPNPGSIGNFPDNAVLLAHANNVQIVMTIFDTPGWATCSGSYNPTNPPPCTNPNHLGDFGTFMGALAAHYKGQIAAYEIWNEENVNGTWGNQSPDVPTYFSMLQAAYTNVKAADPTALVISGGLANTLDGNPGTTISDVTYIQQLLGMGGASYLDAIGIHPYPGACDPSATSCPQTPAAYFQRAVEDHNAAVGVGFPNIPFWITEAGYFSPPGNIDPNAASCPSGGNTGIGGFNAYEVDDNTKASWLVQAYQDAYNNWPWLGMFMMMNLDISMDDYSSRAQCDPSRFWAILTHTGQETPAYTALMNMTKYTPQMTLPLLSSLQQVAGVVTLNGSVADPTSSGSTVDAVIVTIGAPFGQTASQATVTLNPDGTFQASFDTSHLTYNQTTLVYVYAHTPSSGWIYGSAGVVPAPQAELSTSGLSYSFTPSQSKTANQTVNVTRNDDPSNRTFHWTTAASASGNGWLTVTPTDNSNFKDLMSFTVSINGSKLPNGSYAATITLDSDSGTKAWLKNMPITIPVTVVIAPTVTFNYHIYLPSAPRGPSLSGLPGIP